MQGQEDIKKTKENGKEINRKREERSREKENENKLNKRTENEGKKTKLDKYGWKVRKT